ncbi:prepilin-type N-terminal cleavage/methylation domain-containing protein [Kribbella voronezhensis]|uniref:Prepilin-type N-terminal cleavage/methylation domain-containing protein n=1 Tax=Kribbella voronezhensis TaxID=2512212 RepID=A0A4R7TJ78_9ACTN|nr:type II secretion system protein [Kribbella voronezhensis]TDU91688.1 prepilin-type N-terminal cleavage/methylation domain-containing protein [Kribbella voronezhensis]
MRLKRGERGFTLVELLITISLMGVITLALGDLLISALREMSATSDRMDLAQDAQLGAAYFAQDVAAVGLRDYTAGAVDSTLPFKESVQVNAAADAGGATCGPLPTSVLRLLSDDWSIAATRRTAVVAYYLQGGDLHRATCISPATVPASDVVVVQNVVPASVSVTCSTSCTALPVPVAITLHLVANKPTIGDYAIALSGLRRQS